MAISSFGSPQSMNTCIRWVRLESLQEMPINLIMHKCVCNGRLDQIKNENNMHYVHNATSSLELHNLIQCTYAVVNSCDIFSIISDTNEFMHVSWVTVGIWQLYYYPGLSLCFPRNANQSHRLLVYNGFIYYHSLFTVRDTR